MDALLTFFSSEKMLVASRYELRFERMIFADMKKIIELRNISKEFEDEKVLNSINLDIYDKQFVTLLGPSGCGKTTTLRIVGGFT